MNDRTLLTDKEIARLLQGTDFMYTHALPRLSIPALSMADGPHGLRKQHGGRDNGVTGAHRQRLPTRPAWQRRGIRSLPHGSVAPLERNALAMACICSSDRA